MKKLFNILKRFFCRINVDSSNPISDLEKRIVKAKEIVKYSFSYENKIFVENYDEVLDVLQYEDTLGMRLFVRDFIARKVDTDECVKHLQHK